MSIERIDFIFIRIIETFDWKVTGIAIQSHGQWACRLISESNDPLFLEVINEVAMHTIITIKEVYE